MKHFFPFIFVLSILFGCNGFAIEKHIVGNYYFVATDSKDACTLSYGETHTHNYGTVIHAMVFEVGYNEEYLFVKQHPRTFAYPPNMELVNYYILPTLDGGMNWKNKNGLIGPLTLAQFQDSLEELHISTEIQFPIVMKKNE